MKSILVVGGTGSFGQAFVKRLLEDIEYDRICVYSRDELKQFEMRMKYDDPRLRMFIGDIRDKERLQLAMHGVDIVVVAAALKQVASCEYNPSEAVKTNVIGAMNVIDCAYYAKVKKVVALSSDKATNNINLYGATKFVGEKLYIAANHMFGSHGPCYTLVKYGNVWGSRGSIFPKWKEILKTSDTVPVTDPNCTRYFMTLDQSVDLVLQSIEHGEPGEIMIPLLPAYKISDLAEAMGAKMNIIGIDKTEKIHETMGGNDSSETAERLNVSRLKEIIKNG